MAFDDLKLGVEWLINNGSGQNDLSLYSQSFRGHPRNDLNLGVEWLINICLE